MALHIWDTLRIVGYHLCQRRRKDGGRPQTGRGTLGDAVAIHFDDYDETNVHPDDLQLLVEGRRRLRRLTRRPYSPAHLQAH